MSEKWLNLCKKPLMMVNNWIEHTHRSILSSFPEARLYGLRLVLELSSLFLRSLPVDLRQEVIGFLPIHSFDNKLMNELHSINSERQVSYPQFIETTISCIKSVGRLDSNSNDNDPKFIEKLTNGFLWAIAQEFPPDLKSRLDHVLPSDLRSRMSLYTAPSSESRVA